MEHIALRRPVVAVSTEAGRPTSRLVPQIGFWSAILTASCLLAFIVISAYQGTILPVKPPTWNGMAAYISSFDPAQMYWVIPCLVLTPTFVVLMTAVQADAPSERRVLAQVALFLGILYAALEATNYGVQLFAVWPSIASGDAQGLGFFAMTNPHGFFIVFESLAYPFQQVGLVFAGLVYTGRGLERWIRWSLIGAGVGSWPIAAVLAWIISAIGVAPGSFILVAALLTDLWAIFLALAAGLLAVHFRAGGSQVLAPGARSS